MAQEMVSRDLVTLGTDVEFMMEGINGEFIPAGLALPNHGMIGCDGAGAHAGLRVIAELRSFPRTDVRDMVSDIGRCLRAVEAHLEQQALGKKIRFLTGHFHHGRAIGGHVHMSSPFFADNVAQAAVSQTHGWCRLMTNTFDLTSQVVARQAAGYYVGEAWDAVRTQPELYGLRLYHFEYRNWGSYLVSPLYAYVVFALTKMSALTGIVHPGRPIRFAPTWDLDWIIPTIREHCVLSDDVEYLPEILIQLDTLKPQIQKAWTEDFIERW